ncbi:hypothetical protein RN001_009717 [Aquatica leii]|uniref:Uncharacterized protein n=1 Tax=Aquatica leii TaxID=1421715 RepID=A0AAN7P8C2_9COLE|nr:hypothetical protein RN001_009717 [Aquatica leii]
MNNTCEKCLQVKDECNKDKDSVNYKCTKWLNESVTSENNSPTETSEFDSLSISDITDDTESEASDAISQNGIIGLNGQTVDGLQNIIIKINLKRCKKIRIENLVKIHKPTQINQKVVNIQNSIFTNIILKGTEKSEIANELNVVNRLNWLARNPVGPIERTHSPFKLVIICHTASESALTQSENERLVRSFQAYHIEIKEWSDISYNFLVGCDGRVYQGRGWGIVGSHTRGYNQIGLGISFIGCFIKTVPNEAALNQAKTLIQYGVEIGEIDKNYVLVGHCQCFPTESPGRTLFKEIQSWDHWSNVIPQLINTDNLSK